MKNGFVKTSTHLLPLIKRSALIFTLMLLAAAWFIPAPLKEAADRGVTPNPSKSAWFLLWIQELVSWSNQLIWGAILIAALLLLLPWLPGQTRAHQAEWFPPGSRLISTLTILISLAILLLTFTAMFFRGANWALSF